MNDHEFERLLSACQEIFELFPEGIVFIGGIAVYLHAVNHRKTLPYAKLTHDADFYISIADMADLRDIEEVSSNRRLSKHQLRKDGFEFDIYTERHSALIVPYDQAMAHSVRYDSLRVASLEHLLALKLEAYRDRRSSSKGQKDAQDIICIGLISETRGTALQKTLIEGYLSEDHIKLLKEISKCPEFLSIAKGNAKLAKELRIAFNKAVEDIML